MKKKILLIYALVFFTIGSVFAEGNISLGSKVTKITWGSAQEFFQFITLQGNSSSDEVFNFLFTIDSNNSIGANLSYDDNFYQVDASLSTNFNHNIFQITGGVEGSLGPFDLGLSAGIFLPSFYNFPLFCWTSNFDININNLVFKIDYTALNYFQSFFINPLTDYGLSQIGISCLVNIL